MPKSGKYNTQYTCGFCGKQYVQKKSYDNHVTFCKIRHTTSEESNSVKNDEDTHLTLKDLNKIVKSLVIKTDKMEKELIFLKGFVDKTIKCANIVDLLNMQEKENSTANAETRVDFTTWWNNLQPEETELTAFFKSTTYSDGLFRFIKNHIDEQLCNVKAFTEKPNRIFIYHNKEWKELEKETFALLVATLRKKFLMTFQSWQMENSEEILNGNGHEDYPEKVVRIMGGNKSDNAIANNIREKLFNSIKTELKSMTKIEI